MKTTLRTGPPSLVLGDLVLKPLSSLSCTAVLAVLALGWAGLPAVAQTSGPTVVHVPATTAYYGKPISVSARARCSDPGCTAAVVYRETSLATEAARPWTRVALSPAPADPVGLIPFAGEIPSQDVSTRGVDYYLEVIDGASVDRQPATAPTQSYHVHTLSPPVLSHVPPGYAQADRPINLKLQGTCSTNACTAKLYFRTSPAGSVASMNDPVSAGDPTVSINDDPRQWERVSMSQTATSSLGDPGDLRSWTADIPARIVDTKGVDYVFSVSDGKTTSWAPGTSYQGYLPLDGQPVSAFHVHVVEPPRMVHVPPVTGAYRQPIPITATSTCPIGRTCTARLYYRTTTSTVLDTLSDFKSVAMTVTGSTVVGSLGTVAVSASIPASVVDTRGVDYFFSISDGSRTAWWPGTSALDGPISVDGARVAYGHVRVLEPPHIVPQPMPAAKQLQPLTITATITCATEHCDADLYYSPSYLNLSPLEPPRSYSRLTMTKVGDALPTPLGALATYRATIPASAVTTRGVAWFVRAWDGYVQTFSPGTPYSGAYVPVGNRRPGSIQFFQAAPGASAGTAVGGVTFAGGVLDTGVDLAWLTRVLEPPHVVHVPVLTVAPDRQIPIEAYTNCIAAACTGELTWRDRTGTQRTVAMTAEKLDPVSVPATVVTDKQDVWRLSAVIPRRDVTDSAPLNYRISASDGYTSDTTPTYPVVVSDKALASVGGHAYTGKAPALYVSDDVDQAGLTVSATAVLNGTATPLVVGRDTTDGDGRYTISDLAPGQYDITVDPARLPAGSDPTAQPLTYRVSLAMSQRVRDRDFQIKAVDRDRDELADFIEPRYGIPAGASADSDGDQLTDGFEVKQLYPVTRPDRADTDGDGTPDTHEDPDLDGLDNVSEQFYATQPREPDSDGDKLTDGYEIQHLSPYEADPTKADTDGDEIPDGQEDPDGDDLKNVGEQQYGADPHVADTDGDALRDGFEVHRAFPFARPDDPSSDPGTPDAQGDPDEDGLANLAEQQHGSDPLSADGDQDDLSDSQEITAGTDPDRADTDGDELSDATEARGSTSPTNPDTDGDGVRDGDDTTSSTVTEHGVSVTLVGRGDLAAALHINPLNATNAALSAPALGQVGASFDIELDDAARAGFDRATIKLPYDAAGVPTTAGNLRVFTFSTDDQAWLPSSTDQSVDTANHMVVAHVDHFSKYSLFDITNWRQKWTSTVDGCHGNPPTIDMSIAFDVGYQTKINDPGFSLSKETARRFVAALGPQDRGAIAEADDSYRVVTSLTSDRTALNAGIADVHDYFGRDTDLEQVIYGGLAPLRAGGPRQLHRARMLILLTSGHSDLTFNGSSVYDANLGNVAIFPIGIGSTVDEAQLRQIAQDTRGQYFRIRSAADLPEILSRATRYETHGDFDDDGLNDCDETDGIIDSATGRLFFSDPLKRDTDSDGLTDGEEAGERASTQDIAAFGTNLGDEIGVKPVYAVLSDPSREDSDGDALSDLEEYGSGSAARAFDTDGDYLSDSDEQDHNTLPYAYSTDGDDYSDSYEVDSEDRGFDPLTFTRKTSKLHYAYEFAKGLACSDLCGSDPDIAWLMGNISSGLLVYGDILSFIGSAGNGDEFGATISLAGLVPVFGDGAASFAKAAKFAEDNPDLADDVLDAINGLSRMRASTKTRLIAELTDGAAGGASRLERLRGLGATDEVIVALARNRKSFADLDHMLVHADEIVATGADARWLTSWREGESIVRSEFGDVPKPLTKLRTKVLKNGTLKDFGRKYDGYDGATKEAFEVKVGTQNRFLVRDEVAKDEWVLDHPDDFPDVEAVVYRFHARKSVTGKGFLGPDKALMDDLIALRNAHPGKVRIEVYLPGAPPVP